VLLMCAEAANLIRSAQRCSVASACCTREVFAIMLSLPLCNTRTHHLHTITKDDAFPTLHKQCLHIIVSTAGRNSLSYGATPLSDQGHDLNYFSTLNLASYWWLHYQEELVRSVTFSEVWMLCRMKRSPCELGEVEGA
jgi:hypothetical protein